MGQYEVLPLLPIIAYVLSKLFTTQVCDGKLVTDMRFYHYLLLMIEARVLLIWSLTWEYPNYNS